MAKRAPEASHACHYAQSCCTAATPTRHYGRSREVLPKLPSSPSSAAASRRAPGLGQRQCSTRSRSPQRAARTCRRRYAQCRPTPSSAKWSTANPRQTAVTAECSTRPSNNCSPASHIPRQKCRHHLPSHSHAAHQPKSKSPSAPAPPRTPPVPWQAE